MFQCVQKYKLEETMTKILGGNSPDLRTVKHNVKKLIWELEIKRWKACYHIYPELNMYYESTSGNKIHAWHKYLNKHPHMYVFCWCHLVNYVWIPTNRVAN